jgi:hypothetical protein
MHAHLRPRRQVRGSLWRSSPQPPPAAGAAFPCETGQGVGSRAVAVGAVLVSPRAPAPVQAGEQRGLACRPGPAISSASSARDVKPMAVADSGPGRVRRPRVPRALGRWGWPSAGLPLSGPDAPHVRRRRPVRGTGPGTAQRAAVARRSGGASWSAP